MRVSSGRLAVVLALGLSASGVAQEFSYKLQLQSPDLANLDADGKIQGATDQVFQFTGNMLLETAGLTGEEGPQGWSCGVRNDAVEIVSTTVDGTVSADAAKGGLVNGGFVVNALIDPAKPANAGKKGMTQAVVLSFTQPITLPPNTSQLIGINTYSATVPATETTGFVRYEDGLVGAGQPVQCNITFKGKTQIPTLGAKDLTIGPVVSGETQCDDGLDNDSDGKIDCADEDCPSFPCAPESACDDDLDNDFDGQTDCADSDCAGQAVCQPESNCTDGVDNDQDGQTDCADSDCAGQAVCQPESNCTDGVDNDQDGKTDCDDEDCAAQCPTGDGLNLALDTAGTTVSGLFNLKEIPKPAGGTEVEVTAYIVPVGSPLEEGAQGWSISVEHDAAILTIQNGGGFPTIAGTDGGALLSGGFEKTEVVDPARNGGRNGMTSAVVLSFTQPITLDGTKAQSILRSKYTVAAGASDFTTTIEFKDGLRGVGQPVPNVITVKGDTITPLAVIGLRIKDGGEVPAEDTFRRGDANDDGKVNIADPIWIINELVRQGPETACQDAADANDDGMVDLSDAMYLIQWRFQGGQQPTAPFPACGADVAADSLSCPKDSTVSCP